MASNQISNIYHLAISPNFPIVECRPVTTPVNANFVTLVPLV